MDNKLIDRINHSLEELELKLKSLNEQYKKLDAGTMAFDITLKIKETEGKLKSYKEIKVNSLFNSMIKSLI